MSNLSSAERLLNNNDYFSRTLYLGMTGQL